MKTKVVLCLLGGLLFQIACKQEQVDKPGYDLELLTQSKWFHYQEVKTLSTEGEKFSHMDTLRYSFDKDGTFLEEETSEIFTFGTGSNTSIWRPSTLKGKYIIQSKDQIQLFFPQRNPWNWSPTIKVDTIKESWKITKLSEQELVVIRERHQGFKTSQKFEGKKK